MATQRESDLPKMRLSVGQGPLSLYETADDFSVHAPRRCCRAPSLPVSPTVFGRPSVEEKSQIIVCRSSISCDAIQMKRVNMEFIYVLLFRILFKVMLISLLNIAK
ncbi:hypothetical protein CEXT_255141 [Caerostris extrusa]|uniref:Uncharacterized protein n=1 Tax=Caerostris extrusa TaxID=172846 RepID=A0AAV4Y675_CAEEX|nr:hypothetical protein CEXT_255141 [Caerostris extrusa]